MFRIAKIGTLISALALSGCNGVLLNEATESDYIATVGMMTAQNRALRAVPLPTERVTVSVYGLPDLTGQYKEDDTGQSLSRAVTQGGAAVLIKALQDAGERRWFSVLDRSNLENIVRERQIVTEMRRIYRSEEQINANALGPLGHSGILIEGAIIGYDTNTVTGGVGAKYLGVGSDARWKLDVITLSLRAVSTETSEVLASVVVRKPIASVSNRGSIFTYIALDELFEAEAGYAMNEPKQIAIEQATEKAVMALIAEGAMIGLWDFADDRAGQAYIAGYTAQKYDGVVPPGANPAAPPETTSTDIPATVPYTPPVRRATIRQVSPATTAPSGSGTNSAALPAPPPNAPGSEEVVG